ncbi:MAG: ribonucleoside-diphosphate reductase, adenosylcobalamin-dependent [Thermodesulfovibrio sp.]|nr:ribonucleoside-diphosphate reductase, adenosylcobalamin-dependent [Thermodesulfovibrio sp.]
MLSDDDKIRDFQLYLWDTKYRAAGKDSTLDDTIRRYCGAAASVEADPASWTERFVNDLAPYFTPGGRQMQALGVDGYRTTAMNCFAAPVIEDSMDGIFDTLHKAAKTMQAGGGIGFDFSTLRPRNAPVKGVGSKSSGPISFMATYDAMCKTISSAGHRRGAMMAVMRCDHPDIQEFITAKRGEENKALQNFNLSVLITDAFLDAVKDNREWQLVFNGTVYSTIAARSLWDLILTNAYDYAEPGLLFVDRINRMNNLNSVGEVITCTNPCGEQPLPPNGACNLGSINLVKFVKNPFTAPVFDKEKFCEVVSLGVRYLDDVVDVARLPLQQQRDEVINKRRIGLGITGLADMLWMMNMQYDSPEAIAFCDDLARIMRYTAYAASVDIAKEKGAFPLFDRDKYLSGEFIKQLPEDIRQGIAEHGIRNSHLLTIAPTGTTSLLWGNISSGVEPILYLTVEREIKEGDGNKKKVTLDDYAYRIWKQIYGESENPDVRISDKIAYGAHIDMMAVWQKYFDASISKTVIFAPNTPYDEFKDAYWYAYEQGLKGCTVYRPSGKIGAVVSKAKTNHYIRPMDIPDDTFKHCTKARIPEEGIYEFEITVLDGHPRETWMHAPVDHKIGELLEAIMRLMSIALRCNVDPKVLMKQLRKSVLAYGNVSSPLAHLERALLKVMGRLGIRDEILDKAVCPDCGGELVFEEGCLHCRVCPYSRC